MEGTSKAYTTMVTDLLNSYNITMKLINGLHCILVFGVMTGSTCSASLISDGSFETPTVDTSVSHAGYYYLNISSGGAIGAWTFDGPGIGTLVHGNWYGATPWDGNQYLAFNAGQQAPGSAIRQSFGTVPGENYTISFDIGRGGPGLGVLALSAQALDSSTVIGSQNAVAPSTVGQFYSYSLSFKANSGITTLMLSDVSEATSDVDLLLDNVRVECLAPVPEPSTIIAGALLLVPFGVSVIRYSRKTRLA